jgi:hypothetical protein
MFDGAFERVCGFGKHQRMGTARAVEFVRDVALVLTDLAKHVMTEVFSGGRCVRLQCSDRQEKY